MQCLQRQVSLHKLDDHSLMQVFDELPLWSAPFGLSLLEEVIYKSDMNVLDLGCGSGFPLLELAQRLGESCTVYGLDPWCAAISRARCKASLMDVTNVKMVEGKAEIMPFGSEFFDVIVSNNGINNVEDQDRAIAECRRVCKRGGQMLLTANLPKTMQEFYSVYDVTLRQLGRANAAIRMKEHIFAKRKPLSYLTELLVTNGFNIHSTKEEFFTMRFLNGTALLNHFFLRLAFVEPWQHVVKNEDIQPVFDKLEENLNMLALSRGELRLTIPFVRIDCRRK